MKSNLVVLMFAALIFAQTNDVFVPDEIQLSSEEEEKIDLSEESSENDFIENEFFVESLPTNEIQSEILLSIDEFSKNIICDFSKNDEEKIIEILSLSGISVWETFVDFSQKTLNIPIEKFKRGIYIIRIISKENQISILSKAFVIG